MSPKNDGEERCALGLDLLIYLVLPDCIFNIQGEVGTKLECPF